MRNSRIKNTKPRAEGHTESELPGAASHIQALPAPSRSPGSGGLKGRMNGPFPPAACLQYLSALSTLSLPSGIFVILKQNADSWDGTGKESHKEASIMFPEFSPTASSMRSVERGPPCICLFQWHLALP